MDGEFSRLFVVTLKLLPLLPVAMMKVMGMDLRRTFFRQQQE